VPDRLAELAAAIADRYTIERELGRGGNATVYLAHDRKHRRPVAIKVLLPEFVQSVRTERFLREIDIAAPLSHPHILPMHDSGEAAGCRYYVMPYAEGESLRERLRRDQPLPLQDGLRIAREVASALDYAHQRGVVHRDIKPENVLLQAGMAVVADFGIARALSTPSGQTITETGTQVGTPYYMSPEQAAGETVGPPSDVYSLGMMIHELLTGKLPFEARSSMGWAAAHLRDTPLPISQRRPDLAPEVASLIDRCLAKRPEDRPTALEVGQGLLASPETDLPWPPPGLLILFRRTRWLAWFALGGGMASLLLLLALAVPPAGVRAVGEWWSYYAASQSVTDSPLGVRSAASPRIGWSGLWIAALVVGWVGTGVGLIGLAFVSGRTFAIASRQRTRGWRWDTLLDVIADPDGLSGPLLLGAREVARLSPDERREVLRARRLLLWLRPTAGTWLILALGSWAILVVGGVWPLRGAGAVVGSAVIWPVVLPAAVALGVWIVVAVRAARLLAPLPHRRHYGPASRARALGAAPAQPAAWYAAQPDPSAPAPPGTLQHARLIVAAHVIAVLIGIVSLAALCLVATAAIVACRNVKRLGPETAELVAMLGRLDVDDPFRQARQVWKPYLPPASLSDAALSVAWVRALRDDPPYPVPPAQLLGSAGSGSPASLWLGKLSPGTQARVPEDTARLMRTLADHPRTILFRRLARSGGVDLFAASLDRPLEQYEALPAIPDPPYGPLREAAQANALGAILAVSRRDFTAASERLGENSAVAEQFLLVPKLFSARFGAGMLQDLALLPLADVEQIQGHRKQADELRDVAARLREQVYSRFWATRMMGLAADPSGLERLATVLRDERLLPGLRVEGLYGGFAGFCLNPRELLGGPNPARRATILAAAHSMQGVAYASQLAELTSREWEVGTLASAPGFPRWTASLAKWPPGAALVRVATCLTPLS
jgi:hypothetical protein